MAQQVLKNTSAILQQTFSAGAADGTVTVTVTRADGTTVTSGPAVHGTGGVYTFALDPQAELDLLTVTWSGTWSTLTQSLVSMAEIVGDQLFTIAEARSHGDQTLADTTRYPDAAIRKERERITQLFQQVTGVSFIPRYARDVRDNTSTIQLTYPRPLLIRSISIDAVALTPAEVAAYAVYPTGMLVKTTSGYMSDTWDGSQYYATGRQNVVIEYEHGHPYPPGDITQVALELCRYELVPNDISDRAIAYDSELGTIRYSVPGRQYPTGLPSVDATLYRYQSGVLVA